MPLLAFNKKVVPLTLAAGNPILTLASSTANGKRGPVVVATEVMKDLGGLDYENLQRQQDDGAVDFTWTLGQEYPTPGLLVQGGPAPVASAEYPVIVRSIQLDDPSEGEQGVDRSIEIFPALEYPLRILSVVGAISRGAPNAQLYLCCQRGGQHEPHSDRFDASQPGMLQEVAFVHDRVVEAGEELFVYCTSDYVRGYLTVLLQRAA